MQIKGTVDSVYSKTKSTRSGDKTIYYMTVDGQEVNLGFKPTYSEGEYVNIEVEEKWGEWQIVGKGKAGGKAAAPTSSYKAGGKAGVKRGSFPVEPTDSQVSIIRQSSLNRAVDTVAIMAKEGMLADNLSQEELESIIFDLAYKFTDFGTGQREVKMAENQAIKRAALEAVNG